MSSHRRSPMPTANPVRCGWPEGRLRGDKPVDAVNERPGCRALDPPDLARALCGIEDVLRVGS
jgi:hypothetical protein